MEHISSCMRPVVDVSSVYITQGPSSRSQSPSSATLTQTLPSKYQLWPSAKSDKLVALSVGRSSTSLSDTATLPDKVPFWQRNNTMSRRRNFSIAEVGATMTTVQEIAIDSPTIPGRPPLRKFSDASFSYDRTYNSPEANWRVGPFGDALMSCVSGPSPILTQQSTPPNSSEMLTPNSRPRSPRRASPDPSLDMHTFYIIDDYEVRPEVPPKSPTLERKGSPAPLKLDMKMAKPLLMMSASAASGRRTPLSATDTKRSPKSHTPLPTPPSESSTPFFVSSLSPNRGSPRSEKRDPISSRVITAHTRIMSESSIVAHGQPTDQKSDSAHKHSRACSEGGSSKPSTVDNWKLPQGMRVSEASKRMCDADQKLLHKQACDQSSNFEVLDKRDVASLSRELRALDERCDYLRRTYKSLRAGRQKLHSRMISNLRRGDTVIFSRESLLKQEEALAELDVSIDEFIAKLEQAENRRLRLRQKLLEHVAAAIVLNPTATRGARDNFAETTPPRSPVKTEPSRTRTDRTQTESIKIYADGHVLDLFSDIEKAIGHMCEQTC
ncbi:hypothetical protein P153DRAFT_204996 [Dothidotthia symphoricarpi CBS 119687]|uniref:Up-regulated during septation protein 1 domain-containing protein n=1 Tax=Dothidotthia symphoricarpi CBS 119687 TaxID=1392245 RepID=A0A6A6AIR0_9PLEO|nr:uncharacterized protein P153DRAFT_204996 [Dothidotthia symphoricarpi CBS 119687]KAF2130797.1 hypothetical protein P153DRAFT_204996 [Dothidotthia symphoricarpi CBS 119687]